MVNLALAPNPFVIAVCCSDRCLEDQYHVIWHLSVSLARQAVDQRAGNVIVATIGPHHIQFVDVTEQS